MSRHVTQSWNSYMPHTITLNLKAPISRILEYIFFNGNCITLA